MKTIILLGPPGAGKGTQSERLSSLLGIPRVVMGDLLRLAIAQNRPEGIEIRNKIQAGQLVPDTLTLPLLFEKLFSVECQKGVILDGFPRSLSQAQALQDAAYPIHWVIEIGVSDACALERLSGRWTHLASGRVYHTRYNPPRVAGLDDETGEPLQQRSDDVLETIQARLALYRRSFEQLWGFYQDLSHIQNIHLHQISGETAPDALTQQLASLVS